jgi:hypothetical protein
MSDQSLFDRADAELRKAADRVAETMRALVPPSVSEHLANSQREFFLALRSFADAALARTEAGIREARERVKADERAKGEAKAGPTPPPSARDPRPPSAG